jgi:stearoyl-CoA desaturase (delta-9 desaturase)
MTTLDAPASRTAPVPSQSTPTDEARGISPRRRGLVEQVLVYLVVALPVLGVFAAGFVAWDRGGLSWVDVALFAAFYVFSGLGITVGYHRYFTHRAFRANRPLKLVLGVAGAYAMQGPVIRWVADHRRHHAYSDGEGDPHSPWRFGRTPAALVKGFWWAHTGWLFDREQTSSRHWAPDLLQDPDLRRLNKAFPLLALGSLGLPALLGWVLTGFSGSGALSAFIWAGLVRMFLIHHVTWSINSICHVTGSKPFSSRDESRNVWWLALPSFGESWHNLHHADPSSARHGVQKGEVDLSALVIRGAEKLGWASEVRWPTEARMAKIRARNDASA